MTIPKEIIVQIGVGEHIPHTLPRTLFEKFSCSKIDKVRDKVRDKV
jgi:hypothetical protein